MEFLRALISCGPGWYSVTGNAPSKTCIRLVAWFFERMVDRAHSLVRVDTVIVYQFLQVKHGVPKAEEGRRFVHGL